jgi:hypothetical protein
MNPHDNTHGKCWKDFLQRLGHAQNELAQHQLASPSRLIKRLHQRVRVRVQITRVKP